MLAEGNPMVKGPCFSIINKVNLRFCNESSTLLLSDRKFAFT